MLRSELEPVGRDQEKGLKSLRSWNMPTSRKKVFSITITPLDRSDHYATLPMRCVFTVEVFDLVWIMTQSGLGDASHLLSTLFYSLAFNKFYFSKASSVLIIMLRLVIGFTVLLDSIRIEEG